MHIMHILAWCSDKKPFIWKININANLGAPPNTINGELPEWIRLQHISPFQ